ncbi:MAG: hypothetical protein AAGA77_02870 [Bacteroidota bacterium]
MTKTRKLEYFEDQLKTSPQGLAVLQVIRQHAKEVVYLIRNNRATMVCWQRYMGPKFVRSVVDSGFEDNVNFIKEVNGITMESLVLAIAEVLQDNGSIELKRAIGKYTLPVLKTLRSSSSLKEIIQSIHQYEFSY